MGKNREYQLPIATLAEGHHEWRFKADTAFFENMECTEVVAADVDVALTITAKNQAYYLDMHCTGWIDVPCDRCLEPIRLPVDARYSVTVKYGPEYDDSSDEVLIIPETERMLDVSGLIYDTILLTIPLRHVHAEGECDADMASLLNSHDADDADSEEEFDELD